MTEDFMTEEASRVSRGWAKWESNGTSVWLPVEEEVYGGDLGHVFIFHLSGKESDVTMERLGWILYPLDQSGGAKCLACRTGRRTPTPRTRRAPGQNIGISREK